MCVCVGTFVAQSHPWDFTTDCIIFSVRDSASKLLLYELLGCELVHHYHMNTMVCGIIQIIFCLHVCHNKYDHKKKKNMLCATFGPLIMFGALTPIIKATGEII